MSEYWDERWRQNEATEIDKPVAEAVGNAIIDLDCESVLDFGCGVGRWRPFFQSRGYDYFGHDASIEAIKRGSAKGIVYGQRMCDIVFTNTVLIHADDSAFAEILSLARKYIVCLETVWPKIPSQSRDHMRYRTIAEFVNLFASATVERIERVGVHHLFVFSKKVAKELSVAIENSEDSSNS